MRPQEICCPARQAAGRGAISGVPLLPDLLGVVVLPLLLALVVRVPVDLLELGLDLVERREVLEVIRREPARNLADVAGAEEALAQLAPGPVFDRPVVRELDLRAEAPVDEDLGEDRVRGTLRNPEIPVGREDR